MSKQQEPIPFSVSFAAGAIAGISEILTMYPLDVVKTRVQLQDNTAKGADRYNGMVDCFRKIIKNEGFSRLYRGIAAPILMEAPKRATKFAANDEWGKIYRKMFGVAEINQSISVLTGASAGATESFVVVPFELVKIRLQDKKSSYNGPIDVVKKVVASDGLLGLYTGLESTMWRHVLWNAGYFGVIFQVKKLLPKSETKRGQMTNDLVAGSIGGTVGTIVNTPADVVKSRIQNTVKVKGVVPKYNWTLPSIALVAKEEGFAALYKGFLPKVLRLGPGGGILLVVFTSVIDFYKKMRADGKA
ncbi:mitochondrial inner membrane transporter, exports 2-oxoadipate and 2-oxoglutarate from the mitochond [Choiromyces venosus 120613-1]|uniref:Mitochondrial inner membrane transporter, exports 2-oxoadipate and 2-oxoglutarate from the mitochond n=1 Tax=Choiromyces venosus 120613-1 TaxID=1336337 RepID=A0A3N4JN68_9PEZI|nr:mitochondrial inner membrane transporter, exports 2-oxoadipate and 2-oxoglutarate from the mitochond [Choiromyces venosus 120613-1]